METTININADILNKITVTSQTLRISRSELIMLLFKKIMDDVSQPSRFGRMVQYQGKSNKESWKTFHLVVREDDYEYLLDLRKLLKMSVSLILAFVVKKYLGKTIITDNKRYQNYVIIKEMVDNIISWRLFWGYPPSIGKFLHS